MAKRIEKFTSFLAQEEFGSKSNWSSIFHFNLSAPISLEEVAD